MEKAIFGEISARVTAFMESNNKLLLEKCHVGSGKTWNTIKTIEDRGDTWIYLAPFHTVIDENLRFSTLRNYNYIHLKSRAKLCLILEYKRIAKYGIDIRPICETSCPLKDTTCPYYETKRKLFREACSWAGVHHHLKDFIGDFFHCFLDRTPIWKFYDVMIIDENPINVLFENEYADSEEIAGLRDIIRRLNITHVHTNAVIEFLDFLITSFVGREQINYQNCLAHFQAVNWKSFYDDYQAMLVDELRVEHITLQEVPREFIKTFGVLQTKINENTIQYMIVKKNASAYTRKKFHFMGFDNHSLLECPIKMIGLDGTANPTIWESITGKRASILERRYVYNNIYQLRGRSNARYPLSSWVREGEITVTGKRLCQIIDQICRNKPNGKVLIACTKPLQPFLARELTEKNKVFCNYYYIRSRNEFYETCDTIVLTCEPNIQRFQIECFAHLSDWDEDVWRQVFTQEEMIQTVGRIREDIGITISGRIRNPREIYILPYTPMDNKAYTRIEATPSLYPEARVMDFEELLMFVKGVDLDERENNYLRRIQEIIDEEGRAYKSKLKKEFKIPKYRIENLVKRLTEVNPLLVDRGGKLGITWKIK